MSASSTPTLCPCCASATARLTVTEDLPTPPLPDAIAMTFVGELGFANVISGCAVWPLPVRRSADSCARSCSFIEPKAIWTLLTPSRRFTAAVTSLLILSFSGQPGTVSLILTPTVEPSMTMSSTMPSSVMGLLISGSLTVARTSSTSSFVATRATFRSSRRGNGEAVARRGRAAVVVPPRTNRSQSPSDGTERDEARANAEETRQPRAGSCVRASLRAAAVGLSGSAGGGQRRRSGPGGRRRRTAS